jgi:hypothetical protein
VVYISVAHLCTVIDVPQSELLNLASGHRVLSFTDGTQWTYIPINQGIFLSLILLSTKYIKLSYDISIN